MSPRTHERQAAGTTGGDCYEAAGKYMMDQCGIGRNCNLRLVHGEVAGQGPLRGKTFGHAWVENGTVVFDNSNGQERKIPRDFYYALGHIDEIDNRKVYTWEQARKKILQHKHWGPWDFKSRSGL